MHYNMFLWFFIEAHIYKFGTDTYATGIQNHWPFLPGAKGTPACSCFCLFQTPDPRGRAERCFQKDLVIYIIQCSGMFYGERFAPHAMKLRLKILSQRGSNRNVSSLKNLTSQVFCVETAVLSLQALNRGKGLLPEPNAMQILTGLSNPATIKMLLASLNPGHKQGASTTLFFNSKELWILCVKLVGDVTVPVIEV